MEVVYWDGGLTLEEVDAIRNLELKFSPLKNPPGSKSGKLQSSMADQLSHIAKSTGGGMFPWKGYAGFRFVDKSGNEGEYDLVIVTHKLVLIVELKHWNHSPIKVHGDHWFKGTQDMGRSPVSITQKKVYTLKNKLNQISHLFPNGKIPWIDFCVVMTGDSSLDNIPDEQRKHVMALSEFIKLANETEFDRKFNCSRRPAGLNENFDVFDKLISGINVKPSAFAMAGYCAEEADKIFDHPQGVYSEYEAKNQNPNQFQKALLRRWNFDKVGDSSSKTQDGRFKIVTRELNVLSYIHHHDLALYKQCLRSLSNPVPDDMTREYCELYELPPGHKRFNEFIDSFVRKYSFAQKLALVKLLICQFSHLHQIKVAHRDIGDHSIWLSPGNAISLSNLISAYYQPAGTIGPQREILSIGTIGLPEDDPNGVLDKMATPFHRDVFCIGLLAWHIFHHKRLAPISIQSAVAEINASNEWYSGVLKRAISAQPSDRFDDAYELLNALNSTQPNDGEDFSFDLEKLNPFRKNSIRVTQLYPKTNDAWVDTDDKEIYQSNDLVVKIWNGINLSDKDLGIARHALHFLEGITRLQSEALNFVPTVKDFGLSVRESSLFIVSDWIDGVCWGNLYETEDSTKYLIIEHLIKSTEILHERGLYHGDLHPGNIMVSREFLEENSELDNVLFFLDFPDFSADQIELRNNRYSPLNIDSSSGQERDNFAVMRLSIELLGMDWDEKRITDTVELRDAIENEKDGVGSFLTLSRFKDAFESILHPKIKRQRVCIRLKSLLQKDSVILMPDNGSLYLKIEKSQKFPKTAIIQFNGIGGELRVFYNEEQRRFNGALQPREFGKISDYQIKESQFELDFELEIKADRLDNFSELENFLFHQDIFLKTLGEILTAPSVVIEDIIYPNNTEQSETSIEIVTDNSSEELSALPAKRTPLNLIWRAIIDTEVQSRPSIEVGGPARYSKDRNYIVIPYSSKGNILENFEADSKIELTSVDGDRSNKVGVLELAKCSDSELYLFASGSNRLNNVKAGAKLFLTTQMDKSSFARRKSAIGRVLDDRAVTPRLLSYFDDTDTCEPKIIGEAPTEDDFNLYDRRDRGGAVIKLNDAQCEAFTRLITTAPVCFLQGPPGTGKTEFIAAFCHYIITKTDAQNILLVSQSHEAVNTAAERIREHCERLDTTLDIVRFSNRDVTVSDELMDVYSKSIVRNKRELFQAEKRQRILALGISLGVNQEYLNALITADLKIFVLARQFIRFGKDIENDQISKKEKQELRGYQDAIYLELDMKIQAEYGLKISKSDDVASLIETIRRLISRNYGIAPHEARRCESVLQIASDFYERLSNEGVNYDEFLARTRTLVCGTCVGVGHQNLNIANNQYDWVIIDEAARSSPSELSVAMQSGRRILLVGDHCQLPPTYQDEHVKAIARRLGVLEKSPEYERLMRSDFERAFESNFGKVAGATLTVQYRMQEAIGNLISKIFYKEKLRNGERAIPKCFDFVPDTLKSVVTWLDTGSLGNRAHHDGIKGNPSIFNVAEIDQIIILLKRIEEDENFCVQLAETAKNFEPTIGIICMYGEQKRLLRKRFNEQIWREEFSRMVKIDTVDSYQGKENRIVIVSLTRSDSEKSTGFLRIPNRINVALSRAMDRLVIVGDIRMWNGKNIDFPLGQVASYIQERQKDSRYSIVRVNKNSEGKSK
ncbi:AAA domain-containing protein [Undibacterium sp. SXout20W]|uniref:AAA domain-containing protein n=1 Tax=Undibacterium sp. SXout20W TaxID=3413051 RepID=UPI003BEFAF90